MKKRIIYGLSLLVIAGIVLSAAIVDKLNQSPSGGSSLGVSTIKNVADKSISYKGMDGVTALDLLKQNATISASGEGANTFVIAINGLTAGKNQYWSFLVDGKEAAVGAGSYVTKSTETISWKLASF